jgi:glutamate-1-semialdehyde aminotransferase
MSKFGIRLILGHEIKKVNKLIDEKIIRGLPYGKEARYHRALKSRLALLDQTTFMARTMRIASFLMF